MTVKAKVGRSRHVVFRVDGARLPRAALSDALRRAGLADARLTRYDGALGVVRVTHERARAAREALARMEVAPGARVATLGTSGTLRAAVARFAPALRAARAPGADVRARSPPDNTL